MKLLAEVDEDEDEEDDRRGVGQAPERRHRARLVPVLRADAIGERGEPGNYSRKALASLRRGGSGCERESENAGGSS